MTDILSADDFPKNNVAKVRILRNGKELEQDVATGFDGNGNVLIIHCASGYNNVVVTGKSGFTSIARPIFYHE